MKQPWIKIILNVSRILFGFTFLFSGFVKAVDPMGSTYKFIDYFREFGLTALNNLALIFAILLAAIEFTIGACILFGSSRKLATTAGLLFMAFFTPLTLYLAIANPVSDCGCFGDALVLTNWETFWKNMVLLPMAILLFLKRNQLTPFFANSLRWFPTIYAFIFSIIISQIGLTRLPILDFRPFRTGINITEEMYGSTNAQDATYILVYKKDGILKGFTLENYPADDQSWEFVETKTILPENTKQPTIKDFFLTDENGVDVTSEILADSSFTFLLISPDWNTASDDNIDRINALYSYAEQRGYHFYGVSVHDMQKQQIWGEGTGAEYPFLYSDATILETVIRANPGIILLKEGTIVWKKNVAQLPSEQEVDVSIKLFKDGFSKKNEDRSVILYCVLLFFGPILVLLSGEKAFSFLYKKSKKREK